MFSGIFAICLLLLQNLMRLDALEYVSNSTIDLLEQCISNSDQSYNYTRDETDQLFIVLTEMREYEKTGRDIILASCINSYGNNASITVVFNPDWEPDFPNDGILDHDAWNIVRSNGLSKIVYLTGLSSIRLNKAQSNAADNDYYSESMDSKASITDVWYKYVRKLLFYKR